MTKHKTEYTKQNAKLSKHKAKPTKQKAKLI